MLPPERHVVPLWEPLANLNRSHARAIGGRGTQCWIHVVIGPEPTSRSGVTSGAQARSHGDVRAYRRILTSPPLSAQRRPSPSPPRPRAEASDLVARKAPREGLVGEPALELRACEAEVLAHAEEREPAGAAGLVDPRHLHREELGGVLEPQQWLAQTDSRRQLQLIALCAPTIHRRHVSYVAQHARYPPPN